jgi:hypothetical protein
MIVCDFYRTREDGVELFHIYSDTDNEIQDTNTLRCYFDVIEDSSDITHYVETSKKLKVIEEPEIENGDQELTDEEAIELLKEVF